MNSIRQSFGTPSISPSVPNMATEYRQVVMGGGNLIGSLGISGSGFYKEYFGVKATGGTLNSVPTTYPTTPILVDNALPLGLGWGTDVQNGQKIWIGGYTKYLVGTDEIAPLAVATVPKGSIFLVFGNFKVSVNGTSETTKVWIPALFGA